MRRTCPTCRQPWPAAFRLPPVPRVRGLHHITEAVAAFYGMTAEAVRSHRERFYHAPIRQLAMRLMLDSSPAVTLVAVGRELGGRDHSTVNYGARRAAQRMAANPEMRADYLELRRLLETAA